MIDTAAQNRISQREHENEENRHAFPFAEPESRPEGQVKERNHNHIPGIIIGHPQAGEIPQDLCQVHPLARQQADAGIDEFRQVKRNDDRQDPSAEKALQIIRFGLEAFV